MKIFVIAKGVRFALWAPLSLIKMKAIYKPLIEKVKKEEKIEGINVSILGDEPCQESVIAQDVKALPSQAHKILRDFKKEFGSFTLVDIEAVDGTKVKITL